MPQAWPALTDEQMNFGFVPGDEGISEPYFFITHWAQAGQLAEVPLPDEARLQSEGWTGIVLSYQAFRNAPSPESLLLSLWQAASEVMTSTVQEQP